ncbi:MAG: 4'-phosphopantetheinyl transferase superfamily protein [Hahellaceae bacterium]|nr:4'-phosphopantetheinyl transferase superfamily protein [Hahellaceae bacterium]MCP5211478.1 4'-phosphopantetheinyl transferase superfamily protein [Hahellaceae bacterium]
MSENCIAIYVAKIPPTEDTPESLVTRLQDSWLSEAEQQRVLRFRFLKDQQLSLASKQITRAVLGHMLECEPQTLVFAEGRHGKPFLPDHPTLHFNLSHTANTVVLAASQSPALNAVGVDVEIPSPGRGSYKLARRFFCADENLQLAACQPWEPSGLECFNQFWTLKESFIKGMGTGLSTSLSKFGFNLRIPGKIGFHCADDIDCGPFPWHFATYHFDAATRIALGFQSESAAYDTRFFKISDYFQKYKLKATQNQASNSAHFALTEVPVKPVAKSWDS